MKAKPWSSVKRIIENQYSATFAVQYMNGKTEVFSINGFPPSYVNKPYTKTLLRGDPGIIIYTPIRS